MKRNRELIENILFHVFFSDEKEFTYLKISIVQSNNYYSYNVHTIRLEN
jgi:hypothetical protein